MLIRARRPITVELIMEEKVSGSSRISSEGTSKLLKTDKGMPVELPGV